MDADTRADMQGRLGHDFGQVRIHADARAARSAQEVDAEAYTVGTHVAFAAGRYAPATPAGRRLLAHELMHVVGRAPLAAVPGGPLAISDPADPQERAAAAVGAGGPPVAVPHPPGLHRQQAGHAEARGTAGEAGMAFAGYTSEQGWAFLTGPGSHRWNEPGFDGVAFRTTGPLQIDILDNKSLARGGNVSSASALTRNLTQNLQDTVALANQAQFNDVPRIAQVRMQLQATLTAVRAGQPIPSGTNLVVTNFGGASTGVTATLAGQNIQFRNLMTGPPAAPPTAVAPGGGQGPPAQPVAPQPQGSPSAARPATAGGPSVAARGARPPPAAAPAIASPPSQTPGRGAAPTAREVQPPPLRSQAPVAIGPSRGQIKAQGAVLGLQALGAILNAIGEHVQKGRVEAAWEIEAPAVQRHLSENPHEGALAIVFFVQNRGHHDSPLHPAAVFTHIEVQYGASRDEARRNGQSAYRQAAGPNEDIVRQESWIPPPQPRASWELQAPFPVAARGSYAATPIFQDVEWGGITGFDDEGETSVPTPRGIPPVFHILQPARRIPLAGYHRSVDIPVVQRAAASGGDVPAVDLDPDNLFGNVAACAVFPADAASQALLAQAPATHDNLSQLQVLPNFTHVRWIRPENLTRLP